MRDRKNIIAQFSFVEGNCSFNNLEQHLKSVADTLEKIGEKIEFKNLFTLTGWLHDFGKLSVDFQNYIYKAIDESELGKSKKQIEQKKGTVDHGKYGAFFVNNTFKAMNDYEKITIEILEMVTCYHHGGLNDYINFKPEAPLLVRLKDAPEDFEQVKNDYYETILSFEKINKYFKAASKEIEIFIMKDEKNKHINVAFLIKFLYSALIDADRWDAMTFMDEKREFDSSIKNYLEDYQQNFQRYLNKICANVPNTMHERKIKKLRGEISDICLNFAQNEPGVYALTVPTGGGKTLATLRFALEHTKIWEKERVIYVIPFTSIITQNTRIISEALGCGDELLEHHCNVVDSEDEYYKLLTQRWNVPLICTTMVRFLDTFFKGGSQDIQRLHHMMNSVIIFDEIQSIPKKCIYLFNSAVNFLSKICHSTIVLCSATQPPLYQLKNPIFNETTREMVPNYAEYNDAFKRVKLNDMTKPGGYSYNEAADFIVLQKKEVKSVLAVLNTRDTAEKVYKAVKNYYQGKDNSPEIILLSNNLCSSHLKKIIQYLEAELGERSIICISTQLIEAGVDLSFECVIRQLAGMDSIIQAVGRQNRHGEGILREAYIINLQNEDLSHLLEIELGEQHTAYILKKAQKNKMDLLKTEIVENYYKNYYRDSKIEALMNYPCPKENINLFDLYSGENGVWRDMKKSYTRNVSNANKKFDLCLKYPFKTAGKLFKVIEEDQKMLLVPYENGKELINRFFTEKIYGKETVKLKELQNYCVSIGYSKFNSLEKEALIKTEIDNLYILKDGYYDKKIGVTDEKSFDLIML